MPDGDLVADLLRRSEFVFEATVDGRGKSTVSGIPVDDHTVIVSVDRVLHGPAAFARVAGSQVTVQLLAGSPIPADGERTVFFTSAVAFGEGIAVAEVGRTDPDTPGPVAMAAGIPATVLGARPGRPHPVLEVAQRLGDERLAAHADEADAVVIGRVVAVERVGPASRSEHDPEWWRATIDVEHTEKGEISDQVQVLFPNSSDVHWARIPKPHPGQEGLWLLHATPTAQESLGPFSLLDADDVQPSDHIDIVRRAGN